jgi:peptidoglycan/LPS O-acetylase OafA/YrhL
MAKKVTKGDPRNHNIELDALRGIAILGAVTAHSASGWFQFVQVPLTVPLLGIDVVNLLTFWGTGGLTLFFLLSGYLLTWTEEKRARSGIYSVRSFALRRVLRLVPAYYVAIVVAVVSWPHDSNIDAVLMHMSFLHALHPLYVNTLEPAWWSLTPEILFYCLLPFIILKFRRLSSRITLFGVFALITLLYRLYLYYNYDVDANAGDPAALFHSHPITFIVGAALYHTQFVCICLAGVLLRMLVEYFNGRPASRLRPRLATALFLISTGTMGMWLCLGLKHPLFLNLEGNPLGLLIQTPIDLLVIAFFASAVLGAPPLRRVLKWRFLAFTGMISYSMFLLHDVVLRLLTYPPHSVLPRIGLPDLSTAVRGWVASQDSLAALAAFSCYTLVFLMVAFPISYLSYRYVESPFLSYKPK